MRKKITICLLFQILFYLIFCYVISAEEKDDNITILEKVFTSEVNAVPKYFDESFIKEFPEDQIKEIIQTYKIKLGNFNKAIGNNGSYDLIFTKGKAPCKIALNEKKLIIGLWLGNYEVSSDNLQEILKDAKRLEGKVSITIIKNNSENILNYNSDIPLAVGSSFKLYILKALGNEINKENDKWEKCIKIEDDKKSLPTGILQDWPNDSSFTLKTLANLMISISDNTAADHLLFYIGREKVEQIVPDRAKPFLSTLELFKIKYIVSNELKKQYLEGNIETKRKILNDIYKINKDKIILQAVPTLIDKLEWFFTTKELCQIIYDVKDNTSITINPGLADKKQWNYIGYKGGSEPGVLQYTHLLQREKGKDYYAVSTTINNSEKEVDVNKFTEINSRLINLIAKDQIK